MDQTWNISSLLGFGFTIWYATGIDDAIIFGSIMAGAKSRKEKWAATFGFLAMYVVMLGIVISIGSSLTVLLDNQIAGIPLKSMIFIIASAFVFKLGLDAWRHVDENDSHVNENTDYGWFDRGMALVGGGFFPRIAQDSFKGFGLNCTDDIAVNSANIIGKMNDEIFWYLLGNFLGVLSMIIMVWVLYRMLRHFADGYGTIFNRVRAIAIWFAALLILNSTIA